MHIAALLLIFLKHPFRIRMNSEMLSNKAARFELAFISC